MSNRLILSEAAYAGDLNALVHDIEESGWAITARYRGRHSPYAHKYEFSLKARRSADDGRPDFGEAEAHGGRTFGDEVARRRRTVWDAEDALSAAVNRVREEEGG